MAARDGRRSSVRPRATVAGAMPLTRSRSSFVAHLGVVAHPVRSRVRRHQWNTRTRLVFVGWNCRV